MKKSTKTLTILTLAVIVGFGSMAYVTHAESEKANPSCKGILSKLAALGVTNEQKGQIRSILSSHYATVEPMIKQLITEHRALRDLIHADNVDEAAIRAQVEKTTRLRADLAVQWAYVAKEIHVILKPDQIEKLQEIKKNVDENIDKAIDRIGKKLSEG